VLEHLESSLQRIFEPFCRGGAATNSGDFNHSRNNAAVREGRQRSRGQFHLYNGSVEHAVDGSVVEVNDGGGRDGYITGQQVLIGVVGCVGQDGGPLVWNNRRQGRRLPDFHVVRRE
jgi:hypothetical protein